MYLESPSGSKDGPFYLPNDRRILHIGFSGFKLRWSFNQTLYDSSRSLSLRVSDLCLRNFRASIMGDTSLPIHSSTSKMIKVGAVQAEPGWVDLQASVDKTIALIEQASKENVNVLGFPEVWIPGYPWYVPCISNNRGKEKEPNAHQGDLDKKCSREHRTYSPVYGQLNG